MDQLTRYIDWYIKKKLSTDPKWQKLDITYSNEKASGEGEHKLINFIRHNGDIDETYCINGLDADLVMLALGTHMPKFYILREDLYSRQNVYYTINIGEMRDTLKDMLKWESSNQEFNERSAIDDFILMCFMVGNDFLPHIPSIEIVEDGIEKMIELYKEIGCEYGHLTSTTGGKLLFIPKIMQLFLKKIADSEKQNLEKKLVHRESFFPDELLDSCSFVENGFLNVNIDKYRNLLAKKKWHMSIYKVCNGC